MAKGDQITQEHQSSNPFINCLVPLLDALGWQGEKRFIYESIPVDSTENMKEEELLTTMANLGYNCKTCKSKLKHIDPRSMPCFFITNKQVPLILLHFGEKGIFSYNGKDSKYLEINKFNVSGKALYFQKTQQKQITLNDKQAHWFTNVLARFKVSFAVLILISLLLALLTLLSPLFIMFVYDQVLHSDSVEMLKMLTWGVGIYIIAFGGATYLRNGITRVTSIRLGNIVGNQVVRRILYLPLSYTEIASLGSQLARIKDFLSIQTFFGGSAFTSLCELPFIAILILVLYLIGGNIIIVPVTAIIIFIMSYFFMTYFVAKLNTTSAGASADRQELILEILTNFKAIKFTGKRELWLKRFHELSANWAYQAYCNARINSIINVYSQFLVSISALATIYIGVLKVIDNQMTAGALMAAMILVWRILGPMRSGFSVLSQFARLKKSTNQLNKLMNIPLEVSSKGKTTITRQLSGNIDISQVSIRYLPESSPALLGVNATIKRGECLAICGHEGAGKSTLLKLLMGLYSPQAGRITIDNINVRQIAPISLRKSLSVVPQQPQLFFGSIEDNLKLANPAASLKDINAALQAVGLTKDIENSEKGLATIISEQTISSYSNTFRKKLALARALLRSSKIIILDEATKGLNKQEIEHIFETLLSMKKSRTIIMVTDQHRMLELADKVLWLDKGRVREFGKTQNVIDKYFEIGNQE